MARPSTVRRQASEVREAIGQWHREGRTLDEILDALESAFGVKISRSALHRHVKGLDKVLERANRSRQIAEALVQRHGDGPDTLQALGNLELMHALLNAVATAVDPESGELGAVGPMEAMLLSKALDHLMKASANAERIAQTRTKAEGAAVAAEGQPGEGGAIEIVFVEPAVPAHDAPLEAPA